MSTVGFVQVCGVGRAAPAPSGVSPIPPAFERWIDARVRGTITWIAGEQSPEQDVVCEIMLEPRLEIATVIAVLGDHASDEAVSLFEDSFDLVLGRRDAVGARTLREIFDSALGRAFGPEVLAGASRTTFGTVAVVDRRPPQRVATSDLLERHPGLLPDHAMFVSRNAIGVFAPNGAAHDAVVPYLVLASYFTRTRHVATALSTAVRELAASTVDFRNPDAWLEEAGHIERQGLEARPALYATHFIGDPRLVRIADDLSAAAALSPEERHQMNEQLTALSRYVTTVGATASSIQQRRLNIVGFVVGVIAVVLTGVGALNLPGATARQWIGVGAAWAVTAVVLGFSVVLSSERKR